MSAKDAAQAERHHDDGCQLPVTHTHLPCPRPFHPIKQVSEYALANMTTS